MCFYFYMSILITLVSLCYYIECFISSELTQILSYHYCGLVGCDCWRSFVGSNVTCRFYVKYTIIIRHIDTSVKLTA